MQKTVFLLLVSSQVITSNTFCTCRRCSNSTPTITRLDALVVTCLLTIKSFDSFDLLTIHSPGNTLFSCSMPRLSPLDLESSYSNKNDQGDWIHHVTFSFLICLVLTISLRVPYPLPSLQLSSISHESFIKKSSAALEDALVKDTIFNTRHWRVIIVRQFSDPEVCHRPRRTARRNEQLNKERST